MISKFMHFLKERSKYLIVAAEVLVLLLLVPGVLKGKVMINELSAADFSDYVSSSAIVVPRGILEMEVVTKPISEEYFIETRRLDNGTFYGMKCNDIMVFSGMESVSYEVYVTDRAAHISFHIQGPGFDECPIERIRVYNTHRANSVLICLLIVFFAIIDLLLFKRKQIIEKSSHEKEIISFILAGCTFFSLLPEMNDYISFGVHGAESIVKVESMLRTFRGNGAFLSTHYKDLYLIIPVLLRWIGFPIIVAYKANILLISAATTFITYKFIKICGAKSRLATALTILYILNPYRLYVLYTLCDMRDFTAMAFPPLIILPLIHLNKEAIKSFLKASLTFSCIWGVSGIASIGFLKKKYITELAIVIVIIVSMYFLGEAAMERPAVWLYNIENYCRM